MTKSTVSVMKSIQSRAWFGFPAEMAPTVIEYIYIYISKNLEIFLARIVGIFTAVTFSVDHPISKS